MQADKTIDHHILSLYPTYTAKLRGTGIAFENISNDLSNFSSFSKP
jgi:hypothetical protein